MLYLPLHADDNQPSMKPFPKLVLGFFLLPLAAFAPAFASDKPRPAPPVNPAASYPMHEAHPNEKVTIAADPCDDPEHCKFFRLEYVQHGFLPVRVIITNDRDQPIVLDDVRIQFVPPDGGKEGAATDEDLNRRLFSRKSTQPTHIPLTPFSINKEPVDKKILNDDTDFGFASTVVPAHSTRAGYVFYDTRGIDDPVMKGAELYLKQIHYTDEHAQRTELFPFTLSFDTFLAVQPKPAEKPKPPQRLPDDDPKQ